MEALFASGLAADIVIAVMVAEGIWLVWRGHAPRAVLFALLPGLLIVLGLRAALVGAGWIWTALPLTLSLAAHLADLAVRPVPRRDPAARR